MAKIRIVNELPDVVRNNVTAFLNKNIKTFEELDIDLSKMYLTSITQNGLDIIDQNTDINFRISEIYLGQIKYLKIENLSAARMITLPFE